jgi:restriction endonuclease S subunit
LHLLIGALVLMKSLISNIASISAGHPFRGSIPETTGGNARVIQIRDLDEHGLINWHSLITTNITSRKQPDWLKKGDILFSARGQRNIAALVDKDTPNTLCAPHYFIIRVASELIEPAFLAWQLNQLPAQKYFLKLSQGTAVASIPRSFIAATPLAIPSLEKQQIIMTMATTHLKEKQTLQAMIANRDMQMHGIANELLTNSTND